MIIINGVRLTFDVAYVTFVNGTPLILFYNEER